MTIKPKSKRNRMDINYYLSHKTLWSKFTGLEWIQSRKNQKKPQHLSASMCSFTEVLPSMPCTKVTLSSWFGEVQQVSRTEDHCNKHTHTLSHTYTHFSYQQGTQIWSLSFAWLDPHSLSPTPLLLFAKTNVAARQMGWISQPGQPGAEPGASRHDVSSTSPAEHDKVAPADRLAGQRASEVWQQLLPPPASP